MSEQERFRFLELLDEALAGWEYQVKDCLTAEEAKSEESKMAEFEALARKAVGGEG